jgi:hypothetical protein
MGGRLEIEVETVEGVQRVTVPPLSGSWQGPSALGTRIQAQAPVATTLPAILVPVASVVERR